MSLQAGEFNCPGVTLQNTFPSAMVAGKVLGGGSSISLDSNAGLMTMQGQRPRGYRVEVGL